MKLVLDRKEIEVILLKHANEFLQGKGYFNRVEWDGYRNPGGVTIEHTDAPEEEA